MASARGSLTVLVLAAGQGKRLRSKRIKLVHSVAGRPMVAWVIDAARSLRPQSLVTVVGHDAELVRDALGEAGGEFVLQREQRGTGHAVLQAARHLQGRSASCALIVNGDLPTLRPATLRRFLLRHRRSGSALSVLTAELADPTGYGRVVRDARGRVARIVEHKDATAEERKIREINCGIYCAEPGLLVRVLRRLRPDNAQGEYYLTDAVHELLRRGEHVSAVLHEDSQEVLGVNTRLELAQASRALYARKAVELMERGVTLVDPQQTWIDPRARIGRDSTVYPGVIVEGDSRIGEDCIVRSGTRISESRIGRGVEILEHCVIHEATLQDRVRVGPFAHLRPGSILERESRVGNFVELKKTRLGRGSKANHLAYVGDATTGPECNIGAGTITCNYDGTNKFPTTLGRGVFIGSDTQLVAPVKVENGAYVAAGTTVTKDVPAGSLALSRTKQVNIEGWVRRRNRRKGPKTGKKG